MTTGTPPPLSVDPEQLSAAGGALESAAANLPEAPAPFLPVGADPLSTAIIGQIPAVETPVMTQLPLIKAQSTATARDVMDSAQMYLAADQRNGAAIDQQMQALPNAGSPGGGGGSAAAAGGAAAAAAAGGGSDPMSQMMGMPMQMAGQMAQMPMQVMGAMAAVPQGAMQGVQQAGQQVQQMVGQFGQGGSGTPGGSGSQGGGTDGGAMSTVEPPGSDDRERADGAASGRPEEERAPETRDKADESGSPTTSPGRHRAAESDDGINL
jgi:hypothetical protein